MHYHSEEFVSIGVIVNVILIVNVIDRWDMQVFDDTFRP